MKSADSRVGVINKSFFSLYHASPSLPIFLLLFISLTLILNKAWVCPSVACIVILCTNIYDTYTYVEETVT